jgi:tRNA pseudouridine13 synthase
MSKQDPYLVYPYAVPECSGIIKQQPEDFRVDEQLGFDLSGSGEHLFVHVQKTAMTTQQLIVEIAQQLDVPARQIGYSGLKDKQAVTRQWLSIQLPGCKHIPTITESAQLQVLHSEWHDKKLRVGSHRSNRFEIVVREVQGSTQNLPDIQQNINDHGFANYFGQQRFGNQQDNVQQALKVLNNRHKRKRLSRHKKSLYLSALRSELFNQILSNRIRQGIWEKPVDGDFICWQELNRCFLNHSMMNYSSVMLNLIFTVVSACLELVKADCPGKH